MLYCGWIDGDVCAYHDAGVYRAQVAEHALGGVLRDEYVEWSAAGLLGRMLWLRLRGCEFPIDALRSLVGDVVAELDAQEWGERGASLS